MSSTIIDEFIARARDVSFRDACDRLEIPQEKKGKSEHQGPCPVEGGADRFSVNRTKGVWNCRGCATGGHDGIGLAAHVKGLDLRNRAHFLMACAAVLGDVVPDEGEQETDEEKAAREKRIAEARDRATRRREEAERSASDFREKEVSRARGIWLNALDCRDDEPVSIEGARVVSAYLQARTGFVPAGGVFENLRFVAACSYWHGQDEAGRLVSIHSGPAMIAPFVDSSFRIIGCHQTWIDLSRPPKRRPDLVDENGEALPTKKMRGTKKGGLIPVFGDPAAPRWMVGEGIETVVAVAGPEGFREDTFYCAAGDIGNLAGPADPKSAFDHPELRKQDAAGRIRKVKVAGPVPKDGSEGEAIFVPDHVSELVLLADGDSEPVATASAMARAKARNGREGRTVEIWWPPAGTDFAEAMVAAVGEARCD